jgi:hypothetical protein
VAKLLHTSLIKRSLSHLHSQGVRFAAHFATVDGGIGSVCPLSQEVCPFPASASRQHLGSLSCSTLCVYLCSRCDTCCMLFTRDKQTLCFLTFARGLVLYAFALNWPSSSARNSMISTVPAFDTHTHDTHAHVHFACSIQAYRRLLALQNLLVTAVPHVAGLNPRTWYNLSCLLFCCSPVCHIVHLSNTCPSQRTCVSTTHVGTHSMCVSSVSVHANLPDLTRRCPLISAGGSSVRRSV